MQAVCAHSNYQVQLDVFEGPLDLLLHLIRSEEIDIYDIPISVITDQYLHFLDRMQELQIAVAGEFLVMAATLIYIKSQMLLPAQPVEAGEDVTDPRQELVDQLLEHERFKRAADLLHARQVVESAVWPRGEFEFDQEEREAVDANVFQLVSAFNQVVERFKDQIVLEVEHESVTLDQKLAELRQLILVQSEFLFSFFLRSTISRLHVVVTFIALLEMARVGEVRLRQTGVFDDIRIAAC